MLEVKVSSRTSIKGFPLSLKDFLRDGRVAFGMQGHSVIDVLILLYRLNLEKQVLTVPKSHWNVNLLSLLKKGLENWSLS